MTGIAFTVGWFLFMQITVFNQIGYTKWNKSILGNLISKWKRLCGEVGLQHTAVPQPWPKLCGFPALSWSFASAQYDDFGELKRSHCSSWVVGGEGCWAAQASSTWHYYTFLSPAPLPGLYLENSVKMRRLKGILWLFIAIYCCYTCCYGYWLHVFG